MLANTAISPMWMFGVITAGGDKEVSKMKINWKVRFKNPVFIVQLLLAIIMPMLTYAKLTFEDLTTWTIVFNLFKSAALNPYVLGLIVISIWNAVTDPTTEGLCDSHEVLNYTCPKKKIKKANKE